ncbi:MAG TPA: transglycosylase SLT domain-containing protein [Bryobacteraceae bacterium]|nr:transglycosylase SLT domain-containing protein [Bryobacteraceae bacterium]
MLTGCAATNQAAQPQRYQRFFLPPQRAQAQDQPVQAAFADPPRLGLYANEYPALPVKTTQIPRLSDTEFVIQNANDHFTAGKRALQRGLPEEARQEFNRAVETLLSAPENLPDRAGLQRRLEELVDAIYRIDQDQLGSSAPEDQVSYDKAPLDDILEMTFPTDPSLRGKVREQVRMTVSQLPLDESDAVVSFINFFSSTRGRRILLGGMQRSGRYKAMIERILAEEGLPAELIFLAQAESGFQPRAVSNKACVGVWQFAKFRGKEYGLNQTSATDDRMDPEKATRAAARHLHDLYEHFGDWYLAMAAYNCGPGCVDSAVMRTGYADFWELRRRNALPLQTANYVPAILAMVIMSKNAEEYGLQNVDFEPAVAYDSLELQTPTHIGLVAAALDRSLSELKELNPSLIRSVTPAGFTLRVPKGTVPQLEAALQVIPADRRDSWRVHRVEPGDTFAGVAKRYGTTTDLLSAANHDQLPETGMFAAVPVAYPGDRVPVAKGTVRAGGKTASRKTASTKAPVKKAVNANTARKPSAKPSSTAAGKAVRTTAKRTSGA